MTVSEFSDERIPQYIDAARRLADGQYAIAVPVSPPDDIGRLGLALDELAHKLDERYRQIEYLAQITTQINAGLWLEDIMEGIFRDFRDLIPYNRIGLSLIEEDGAQVKAYWAKSDQPHMYLHKNFSAPLEGSSLATILATGQPRILNNLREYLAAKPTSASTRLVVMEGICSSLTCPLIANGAPVGFVFFSSTLPDTYASVHVENFQRIAAQLAIVVEKGRLVSELALQKQAIERQNAELRRLSEMKNTFLGIAAHDLRNPLSNLGLVVDMLLKMPGQFSVADQAELMSEMKGQIAYMVSLLDDLLDISHIESGKLTLAAEAISLAGCLSEAVARHAQLAHGKHTEVRLEPVLEGEAWADPLRLRQILDNLISNAVKYSPPHSVVRVGAQLTHKQWRVEIQDQGPGLTPEDRSRLFQDFAKLSARPTGGENSTGLGLAITRRMVEAHGGQIGVESPPGQGATFWFTLPFVPPV